MNIGLDNFKNSMIRITFLMILTLISLKTAAQEISKFEEKLSFKELIDIAEHQFDLIEYGSKKLEEKGYSWRRTIIDGEYGTRITYLAWASKVEIQSSRYIFEDGPIIEISYNIEFGDSTFSKVEIEHFNKLSDEIKLAGFREIKKKMLDNSIVQLFELKGENYYVMLINSAETKYLLIGSALKYQFDNSLFNECCDPMEGCRLVNN